MNVVGVAHALLCCAAPDAHLLSPSQLGSLLQAICTLVREHAQLQQQLAPSNPDGSLQLSPVDALWLMDPQLRWWQRLCSSTSSSQLAAQALDSSCAWQALLQAMSSCPQPWVMASPISAAASSALLGGLACCPCQKAGVSCEVQQQQQQQGFPQQATSTLATLLCRLADVPGASPVLLDVVSGALIAAHAAEGSTQRSLPHMDVIATCWAVHITAPHGPGPELQRAGPQHQHGAPSLSGWWSRCAGRVLSAAAASATSANVVPPPSTRATIAPLLAAITRMLARDGSTSEGQVPAALEGLPGLRRYLVWAEPDAAGSGDFGLHTNSTQV